jgi:hypothetical protein
VPIRRQVRDAVLGLFVRRPPPPPGPV